MLSFTFNNAACNLKHNPSFERSKETGAYLKGHFRLTSGYASPEYLQCAKVLPGGAGEAEMAFRWAYFFGDDRLWLPMLIPARRRKAW